ncbi:Uncharacterised protein [Citrobacter werkmanii]|uniref:Uncharacterized protein n=1 Tax=Citrobacter werkmanii TaxID=67827 RepID=A0ABM8N5H3_9ENTR|nr:Uncharacterised protein [Citrobacter werkmanii]
MNEFTGSAASQADFIWKNAEDLWGLQAYGLWQDHFAVYLAAPPGVCAGADSRGGERSA